MPNPFNDVPIVQVQNTKRTITCGLPRCSAAFENDDDLFEHWKVKHHKETK